MNNSPMPSQHSNDADCHSFQARLPELFDTDTDAYPRDHPHLAQCAACAALVRDLEYIAAQARLLLPLHDPSPAVWENLQSALGRPASGKPTTPDKPDGGSKRNL